MKEEIKSPPDWEITLNKIIEMRKHKTAPVDTMGSGKLANTEENKDIMNYQTLIALMLSPQTRDETTAKVMDILKEKSLSPEFIHKITEKKLAKLINKVSFYNHKAKHIKQATEIILTKHKGKVPDNLSDLLELPGVGKKIAFLCLQICFDKIDGIAVDTHVHRISNRLGWVSSKNPEETRVQLESWLPKKLWSEINEILVGFGQETCRPIGPKCPTCLALEHCPYGKENMKKSTKEEKRKLRKYYHEN